jgi:hypothetical protein
LQTGHLEILARTLRFSGNFECDVDLHPRIEEEIGECRSVTSIVKPLAYIRQSFNQVGIVKDAHLCDLQGPFPDLTQPADNTRSRHKLLYAEPLIFDSL